MTDEVPADLLAIDDPEVDVAALMADIRARIRRRREALGADDRAFPSYDVTACPEAPDDLAYDANLYHHLRLANELYANMDMEPALGPSALTRVPLLGPLWQRLRPAFHELILVYVNRGLQQQIAVNRHMVSALNQLTRLAESQQRAIHDLQAEVKALRGQGSE